MRQRRRVLLIAESANPEWQSVPLIGWSLTRAIAEETDAHLVTQVRNRDAILRAGLVEGRDFTLIDTEYVAAPLGKFSQAVRGGENKGWTTAAALGTMGYYVFEWEVWRRFKDRLIKGEFDLVHRITPLSPACPSTIASKLAQHDIPFVLGPLNGGIPWPKAFIDRQHAEREWLSHVRSLYQFLPYSRSTRKHSSAIIVGSKYTRSEIPEWARDKTVYIPENGIEPERFNLTRTARAALPLKAAFVGRLVPYKGADILLEAGSEFIKAGQLEIDIIGDGPQRPLLESIVERLGLGAGVHFRGWIPHVKVQETLRLSDVMILPSIREFGGGVVLEAMALGIAPIVADYGGPAELVDENTGIRVPFHDKQSLTDNLKQAISAAISDPHKLDEMGEAAKAKVTEKFTWSAKAKQIDAIYEAVLRGDKSFEDIRFFE
jgi:glycosyltransferase involved in cell wall biosynthesis